MVINKAITAKIEKLGVGIEDLFEDSDQLKAAFIEQNAKTSLNLGSQKGQLKQTFSEIAARIKEIDGSLTGFIKAEETRALKQLDNIEKRLKKAEERNHELAIGQLMGIKEKLFPDGSLQERHQNMLNFYINNPRFVDDLLEHLDPFDFKFHVLLDDG